MLSRRVRGFGLIDTLIGLAIASAFIALWVGFASKEKKIVRNESVAARQAVAMEAMLDAASRRAAVERYARAAGAEVTWTWADLVAAGYLPSQPAQTGKNSLGQTYTAFVRYGGNNGAAIYAIVYEAGFPDCSKLYSDGYNPGGLGCSNYERFTIEQKRNVARLLVSSGKAQAGVALPNSMTMNTLADGMTIYLQNVGNGTSAMLPASELATVRGYARVFAFRNAPDKQTLDDYECNGVECQTPRLTSGAYEDCEVVVNAGAFNKNAVTCPAGEENVFQFPTCTGGWRSYPGTDQIDPRANSARTLETPVGTVTFNLDVRARPSDIACGGGCDPALHPGCSAQNILNYGCQWRPINGDSTALSRNRAITYIDSSYRYFDRMAGADPSFPQGRPFPSLVQLLAVPGAGEKQPGVGVTVVGKPEGATFVDTRFIQTVYLNNTKLADLVCAADFYRTASAGVVKWDGQQGIAGTYTRGSYTLNGPEGPETLTGRAALCCKAKRDTLIP